LTEHFFDTLQRQRSVARRPPMQAAVAAGYNLRRVDGNLGISIDETTTRADIAALLKLIFGVHGDIGRSARRSAALRDSLPRCCARRHPAHPVFNTHHTEHEMLRYLKRCRTATWRWTTR
jgi:glycine dehydrogenase